MEIQRIINIRRKTVKLGSVIGEECHKLLRNLATL